MLRPVYYKPELVHTLGTPERPRYWVPRNDVFLPVLWYDGWEFLGIDHAAATVWNPPTFIGQATADLPDALRRIGDPAARRAAVVSWRATKPTTHIRAVVSGGCVFAEWFPSWIGVNVLEHEKSFNGSVEIDLSNDNPMHAEIKALIPHASR